MPDPALDVFRSGLQDCPGDGEGLVPTPQPLPTQAQLGAFPGCMHRRWWACRGWPCPAAASAHWPLSNSLASSNSQLMWVWGIHLWALQPGHPHPYPCPTTCLASPHFTPPCSHGSGIGTGSTPIQQKPCCPSNPLLSSSTESLRAQKANWGCSPPGEVATSEWHP